MRTNQAPRWPGFSSNTRCEQASQLVVNQLACVLASALRRLALLLLRLQLLLNQGSQLFK